MRVLWSGTDERLHELQELCATLRSYDPRIQADVVPGLRVIGTCDLCGLLECRPDSVVKWTSRLRGEQHARMNSGHLDGWVSGLLLSDLDRRGSALVEIEAP